MNEEQKTVLQKENLGWRERMRKYNDEMKENGVTHEQVYDKIREERQEASDAIIKYNPKPIPNSEFKTSPRKSQRPLNAYKYWNRDTGIG